jgi:hypothetical protein
MCRRLPAVALLLALAASAPAGVISGYDPASPMSHQTYDRFASGYPTAPVPNSSSAFVAAGIDLSGIGWRADNSRYSVTLISPRHVLGAVHVGFGNAVQFVNAAGELKTYTVTSAVSITTPGGGPSDLLLGTLSEAVPATDGVRHFGVAGVTAAQAVGLPVLPYGQNPSFYGSSPHLGTNTIDAVELISSTRTALYNYTPSTPGDLYLIGGDSGGPMFTRANGDLALIGVHYVNSGDPAPPGSEPLAGAASGSTFVPEYVAGLNAVMDDTGYQVTVVPVPEPAGLLAFAALTVAVCMVRRVSRSRVRSDCPAPR